MDASFWSPEISPFQCDVNLESTEAFGSMISAFEVSMVVLSHESSNDTIGSQV
jgi:hypothetical protein